MSTDNTYQTSHHDHPQLFFTVLNTLLQNIPELSNPGVRPSKVVEFVDSHTDLWNEDMVSHISLRYADLLCYKETEELVEQAAGDIGLEYDYVDTASMFACMDKLLREAYILDRFPHELFVRWIIVVTDGLLSAEIADITDIDADPSSYYVNILATPDSIN